MTEVIIVGIAGWVLGGLMGLVLGMHDWHGRLQNMSRWLREAEVRAKGDLR